MTVRAASVHARAAGLLLIVMGPVAALSMVYVPGKLIVAGDAEATAAHIIGSESLLRTAFAGQLIVLFLDIAVAVLLYALLEPVNRTLSMLAATFRLAMAAIRGATLVTHLVALQLLSGADSLEVFSAEQLHAAALQCFVAFDGGFHIDLTFFGLHLILLGWLVYESGLLPRALGILLAIAGCAYLADGFAAFLVPRWGLNLAMYLGWGEAPFAWWFAIRGVRAPAWERLVGLEAAAGKG